jgi:hypothetical protein
MGTSFEDRPFIMAPFSFYWLVVIIVWAVSIAVKASPILMIDFGHHQKVNVLRF